MGIKNWHLPTPCIEHIGDQTPAWLRRQNTYTNHKHCTLCINQHRLCKCLRRRCTHLEGTFYVFVSAVLEFDLILIRTFPHNWGTINGTSYYLSTSCSLQSAGSVPVSLTTWTEASFPGRSALAFSLPGLPGLLVGSYYSNWTKVRTVSQKYI